MKHKKGEQMKKLLANSKGFTLVELMVVISIIGILAVVALGIVRGAQQRAKDAALQGTASNITTALEAYYAASSTGQYPADVTDMIGVVWDKVPTMPSGCGEINSPSITCGIEYERTDDGEGYSLTVDYLDNTKNGDPILGGKAAMNNL